MARVQGALSDHGKGVGTIVRVLDMLVLAVSAWLAYRLRFGLAGPDLAVEYIACALLGVLLGAACMNWFRVYSTWQGVSLAAITRQTVLAWMVAFVALLAVLVLMQMGEVYSRLWLGYWFLLGLAGLILVRIGIHLTLRVLRARGWNRRSVIIFGAGALGRRTHRAVQEASWIGYHVAAYFDDDPARAGTQIDGVPVRSDVDALPEALRQYDACEVWIALPMKAEDRVRELLYQLRHSTANIRLIPDMFGLRLLNYSVTEFAGITVLNLSDTPMTGSNRLLKAIEDRILALTLLVILSPVLAAIALAILWSMGRPVLFSQVRCGWDGVPIRVHKFRTMLPHAQVDGMVQQARWNDPRVTPLGRFLRRSSLDELPQLWNVLRGDMSIVGPRPHALEHDEYYKNEIDDYMIRHKVKPGITGWAQVNGFRGKTETIEQMRVRIEHDLYYIENWSVWWDLRILALTAVRMLYDPRAY